MSDDMFGSLGDDMLTADELNTMDKAIGLNEISRIAEEPELAGRLGLGEDLQRAHDTALIRPTAKEISERVLPPKRKPGKMKLTLRKNRAPGSDEPSDVDTVRSISVVPNELVITNFYVVSAEARRVDHGIGDRNDILIANMSLSVVWVNVVSNIQASAGTFIGVPLKAMSGAANYDGGVLRLHITEDKRFWAQSVGAGPNLVVTIESALRL